MIPTDLRNRLSMRALILAGLEPVGGGAVTLSAATDAIDGEEPDYKIDPQILERKIASDDLSPFAHILGRKLATFSFTTEIKGNLRQNSGALADAPVLARLFQACGYDLQQVSTLAQRVRDPVADMANAATQPLVTFARGGTVTLTRPVLYEIRCTTGGASATAQLRVRGNDESVDATAALAPITVTSGTTAIPLGASGATVTPTWTGNMVVGSVWRVLVLPLGLALRPISGNFRTLKIDAFMDGVRHTLTNASGTFEITAEAGGIAKIAFTFQGAFNPTVDQEAPANPVFPAVLPSQVELSNLTWGSNRSLVAAQWTFNQSNTLNPRMDVNSMDGSKGYRIVSRTPEGGFNPEATTEADHPFWAEIQNARPQTFYSKLGVTPGNSFAVWMPRAQISALPYGDRDGLRIYDVSFRATRLAGNDEVEFFLI